MKQERNVIDKERNIEIKEEKEKNKSQFLTKKQNMFVISLIFLAAFIGLSIYWIYENTGNVTLEQLIFHLKVPMQGTNTDMIWNYIL